MYDKQRKLTEDNYQTNGTAGTRYNDGNEYNELSMLDQTNNHLD
jgi:hypothetical protein